MGNVLYLRNADFSENSVGKVYSRTNITSLFTELNQIVTYDGSLGTSGSTYIGLKSSTFNPSENAYLDIVVCLYRVAPQNNDWSNYASIGFYGENDNLLEVQHFEASDNEIPGNYVQRYKVPAGTKYVRSAIFNSSYKSRYPTGSFLPFSAYLFDT